MPRTRIGTKLVFLFFRGVEIETQTLVDYHILHLSKFQNNIIKSYNLFFYQTQPKLKPFLPTKGGL